MDSNSLDLANPAKLRQMCSDRTKYYSRAVFSRHLTYASASKLHPHMHVLSNWWGSIHVAMIAGTVMLFMQNHDLQCHNIHLWNINKRIYICVWVTVISKPFPNKTRRLNVWQSPAWVRVPSGTQWEAHIIWMKGVKNNVAYCVGHGCWSGRTPGERGSGFAMAMFKVAKKKRKSLLVTRLQNMPPFQNDNKLYFIWAYSCSRLPRAPTPHASLLSFLKIASRNLMSARVRNVICTTAGKPVGSCF